MSKPPKGTEKNGFWRTIRECITHEDLDVIDRAHECINAMEGIPDPQQYRRDAEACAAFLLAHEIPVPLAARRILAAKGNQ